MLSYLQFGEDLWGPLRLFQFISIRAIFAGITAIAFGFVLDITGYSSSGTDMTESWGCAFLMSGIIVALGPIFLFIFRPNLKE